MRKSGPGRDVPPPLELLCLKALWSLQEGSVKAVREVVCTTKPLAYTTVMTVLERLVKRGTITRRKFGRSFVYSPQTTREALRRAALREFLDSFFDGNEGDLLDYLQSQRTVQAPAKVEAQLDAALL